MEDGTGHGKAQMVARHTNDRHGRYEGPGGNVAGAPNSLMDTKRLFIVDSAAMA